jgi:plasmid maintenance system antidote protein VapI
MPTAFESSVGVAGFVMTEYSPITNVFATPDFRGRANDSVFALPHYVRMDTEDRNGGPNHLKAWMRFRKVKGAKLAELLETTPSVISELASSKTALSAKWLRRLAPHLRTTPGFLLDHDPKNLDEDFINMYVEANDDERRQMADMAKIITRKKAG